MGFWAGIKHALNSTLGTEDFIPLDKLIKGQRTLAASDATIAVLVNSTTAITNQEVKYSFVPKTKGAVRIIANGYNSSGSSNAYIKIYKNGTQTALLEIGTGTQIRSIDISVTKSSVYTFEITKYAYIYNLYIGAQIVDGSLFEVNSVS